MQPTLSFEDKKILDKILRLVSPRFFGILSESAYEFLITCEHRLCNLGLVDTYGMYYNIF